MSRSVDLSAVGRSVYLSAVSRSVGMSAVSRSVGCLVYQGGRSGDRLCGQ